MYCLRKVHAEVMDVEWYGCDLYIDKHYIYINNVCYFPLASHMHGNSVWYVDEYCVCYLLTFYFDVHAICARYFNNSAWLCE